MNIGYIKHNLWRSWFIIKCKISIKINKIAKKYSWFCRIYGWYFKRFRFKEASEYGSYSYVKTVDSYNDDKIAKECLWQIEMLIPKQFHQKIVYLRKKGSGILDSVDTIGWIYSKKEPKNQKFKHVLVTNEV